MSRHRTIYMVAPVQHLRCEFCQREAMMPLPVADKAGWDWFTGYYPRRIEVCPLCSVNCQTERNRLFEYSSFRPAVQAGERQS